MPQTQEKRLSIEQQNAVDICCDTSEAITSVTGGAGVGKTVVLGIVCEELRKVRRSVALCAPTGRAARRITELTGIRAKTIHKLLEFPQPDDDQDEELDPNLPRRNRMNPLEQNVVIVDEASMVSPSLFRFLMDALPKGGVIRFFGDNNQLPPVEEGDPPFITMLAERPSVELTWNYRSKDAIVENAQRVLKGSIPLRNSKFEIIYTDDPVSRLVEFAPKEFTSQSCQIITPTRKGKVGTIRVNVSLQMKFNKNEDYMQLDRFDPNEAKLAIRPKDKFIWVKNDYKLNLFNGEMGYIDWIDHDAGDVGIITEDRKLTVPPRIKTYNSYLGHVINYDPRKQLELGYAVTTHKAQGSEFDTIIYYMSRAQTWMLNRRNFYTGITRARERVIVICDSRSMHLSMRKHEIDRNV